jgi:hypothetical protein
MIEFMKYCNKNYFENFNKSEFDDLIRVRPDFGNSLGPQKSVDKTRQREKIAINLKTNLWVNCLLKYILIFN